MFPDYVVEYYKCNTKYLKYKEKTPHRLFSSPYNAFFVLIVFFIAYIGKYAKKSSFKSLA